MKKMYLGESICRGVSPPPPPSPTLFLHGIKHKVKSKPWYYMNAHLTYSDRWAFSFFPPPFSSPGFSLEAATGEETQQNTKDALGLAFFLFPPPLPFSPLFFFFFLVFLLSSQSMLSQIQIPWDDGCGLTWSRWSEHYRLPNSFFFSPPPLSSAPPL